MATRLSVKACAFSASVRGCSAPPTELPASPLARAPTEPDNDCRLPKSLSLSGGLAFRSVAIVATLPLMLLIVSGLAFNLPSTSVQFC